MEGTLGGIRFVPLRESPRKFALVIGPTRTGNDSRGSNACSFPSRVPPPPNRFLDEVDENGLEEYFTLGTEVPRRSSPFLGIVRIIIRNTGSNELRKAFRIIEYLVKESVWIL